MKIPISKHTKKKSFILSYGILISVIKTVILKVYEGLGLLKQYVLSYVPKDKSNYTCLTSNSC